MNSTQQEKQVATVLLFGPQALSFSTQSIQRLQASLNNDPDNAWMKDVIDELPDFTKRAAKQFPNLQIAPAATLQYHLRDWIRGDADISPAGSETLSNALLTPLVVLDQLTQYTQYVQLAHIDVGLGSDEYGPQTRRIESLGFCTGLLTALAVASASCRATFHKYGAVAIRLAALVGAVVDAEEVAGNFGVSKTFSTACRSPSQEIELQTILNEFTEVRVNAQPCTWAILTSMYRRTFRSTTINIEQQLPLQPAPPLISRHAFATQALQRQQSAFGEDFIIPAILTQFKT
jgi:hypothetical protein